MKTWFYDYYTPPHTNSDNTIFIRDSNYLHFIITIIQYGLASPSPDEWITGWLLYLSPTLKNIVPCYKKPKHSFLLLTSFPCYVVSVAWLVALTILFLL